MTRLTEILAGPWTDGDQETLEAFLGPELLRRPGLAPVEPLARSQTMTTISCHACNATLAADARACHKCGFQQGPEAAEYTRKRRAESALHKALYAELRPLFSLDFAGVRDAEAYAGNEAELYASLAAHREIWGEAA
jgi:ribosomal protein L40E